MLFPKDAASRAEAVTIISRLASLLDILNAGVNVIASAWLDKSGALTMSLTIENNTDKTVTLNHASGRNMISSCLTLTAKTCTPGPPIKRSSRR